MYQLQTGSIENIKRRRKTGRLIDAVQREKILPVRGKDQRSSCDIVAKIMLYLALDREIDHRNVVSAGDKCQPLVGADRHVTFSQADSRRLDQVIGGQIVGAQAT